MIFTFDGYGLPIAWQLQREGTDVLVGQVEEQSQTLTALEKNIGPEGEDAKARRLSLFEGMLDKQPAEKLMQKLRKLKDPGEWFVFFDLNHLFRYAEEASQLGFHGNFPTEKDYCYEIDRELAKNFVAENYSMLRVADKQRFSKAAQARAFLESSDELWVLKGLAEDARTVVPDVSDVKLAREQILDAIAQSPDQYESAGFLLELMIGNALELTPSKVYLDGKPVYTGMCIENKPLGAANVGPMTDCAQDIFFGTDLADKINTIAFPKIVDEMARQHRGVFYWDASLYADPRSGKLYFGEFCANRPGYNSLYTEISAAGSATGYFETLAAGGNPHRVNAVAASVRLFNLHTEEGGEPLSNGTIAFQDRVQPDLWLTDVRKNKSRMATAGYKQDIAVITGSGKSISEAAKKAYRSVDEFSFEGAYYRPKFDFISTEYPSSIVNRLEYGLRQGLYRIGFGPS